jgi:chromosome segregation ATPase
MSADPFDPLMSRELTPILTEKMPAPTATPSPAPSIPMPITPRTQVPTATHDDLRVLSYQLEVMQKRVKDLESREEMNTRMEMLASRWEEFLSTAEYRFQKIQAQFQKQHELYKAHFRDLQSKIAVAMGWMKERSEADNSLYENMEEQRQSIQAFEVRLQQWQKVVSEQELQLLNEESDKNRIEKMQAHLQRQYDTMQTTFREIKNELNTLANNSSRNGDQAIRELVERQRNMTQSFELRMQQAQKIMNDQELQMTHVRAELKEALREIARLKGR